MRRCAIERLCGFIYWDMPGSAALESWRTDVKPSFVQLLHWSKPNMLLGLDAVRAAGHIQSLEISIGCWSVMLLAALGHTNLTGLPTRAAALIAVSQSSTVPQHLLSVTDKTATR